MEVKDIKVEADDDSIDDSNCRAKKKLPGGSFKIELIVKLTA